MSANAGFQLFPAPPSTAMSSKRNGKSSTESSRKPSTRRQAIQPQPPPQSAVERSQSPISPAVDSPQQYVSSGRFSPIPNTRHDRMGTPYRSSQSIPPENTCSHTPTTPLMRNTSNASHPHSQAQTPLAQFNKSRSLVSEAPVIRSIFPTYNPDIRLEHQAYYPTVIGDDGASKIPRAVLSKRPYSPNINDQSMPALPSMKSQLQRNPSIGGTPEAAGDTLQSPSGPGRNVSHRDNNPRSPPPRQRPATFRAATRTNGGGNRSPTVEEVSSTEELKELWKATNGWRVSPSEGRIFVLQMTSDPEEPGIHVLSSRTSPFYTVRIEPTSTSAHLTMHRHDPSKAPSSSPDITSKLKSSLLRGKPASPPTTNSTSTPTGPTPTATSSGKGKASAENNDSTTEVLATTLEETHRRHPPNDGLIALLYPTAALTLVTSHHPSSTPTQKMRATAERECARLIWDEDSQHYYLCHPCLSQPFIIRIAKSPAWSRVEYVLEHPELPNDLVRLVKGSSSWLVVDSGTAGGLEARFVVDVAVTALMVVAVQEEAMGGGGGGPVERFEGPPLTPSPIPPNPSTPKFLSTHPKSSRKSKRNSRFFFFDKAGLVVGGKGEGEDLEVGEMELELESQEESVYKRGVVTGRRKEEEEERLPCALRCLVWAFKVVIWVVGAVFGCAIACVVGGSECLARRGKAK